MKTRCDRYSGTALPQAIQYLTPSLVPEFAQRVNFPQLKATGREFWCSVFDNGSWLWQGVDRHLVELTAELMDERKELRELTDQQPENTRLRAALRQLDKQLVSNLSLLGFTPSDRSRLGLVQVKTRSKLQELMERKHGPDWDR